MLIVKPAFCIRTPPNLSYILTNPWNVYMMSQYKHSGSGQFHASPDYMHPISDTHFLVVRKYQGNSSQPYHYLQLQNMSFTGSSGAAASVASTFVEQPGIAYHPTTTSYTLVYYHYYSVGDKLIVLGRIPESWVGGTGPDSYGNQKATFKWVKQVYTVSNTGVTKDTELPDYDPTAYEDVHNLTTGNPSIDFIDFGDKKIFYKIDTSAAAIASGTTLTFRGVRFDTNTGLPIDASDASANLTPDVEFTGVHYSISRIGQYTAAVSLTYGQKNASEEVQYRYVRYILKYDNNTLTVVSKDDFVGDSGTYLPTVLSGTPSAEYPDNPDNSGNPILFGWPPQFSAGSGIHRARGIYNVSANKTYFGHLKHEAFVSFNTTTNALTFGGLVTDNPIGTQGPDDTENYHDKLGVWDTELSSGDLTYAVGLGDLNGDAYMYDFDMLDFTTEETFGVSSPTTVVSPEDIRAMSPNKTVNLTSKIKGIAVGEYFVHWAQEYVLDYPYPLDYFVCSIKLTGPV